MKTILEILKSESVSYFYCMLFPPVKELDIWSDTNCKIQEIKNDKIIVKAEGEESTIELTENGECFKGGACVLFPTMSIRDWGLFRAEYVVDDKRDPRVISLLEKRGGINASHHSPDGYSKSFFFINRLSNEIGEVPPATNVYERKYLLKYGRLIQREDLLKKFKKGDVIKRNEEFFLYINIDSDHTLSKPKEGDRLATSEEIDIWNKELYKEHLHYSKTKRELIFWPHPWEPVIVLNPRTKTWLPKFFSHYLNGFFYMISENEEYKVCLPDSEDTRKLIGTKDL